MIVELQVRPLTGLPLIQKGDNLGKLIVQALTQQHIALKVDDVVVVSQKIVSKAEGRLVHLADVIPSRNAIELATEVEKDARLVELILRESIEVIRKKKGVLITKHRLGHVSANAGIDQSNIEHRSSECALLLPNDPDRSAEVLQQQIVHLTDTNVGVIICDSTNRPWRIGTVAIAIGVANLTVFDDYRHTDDLFGRTLKVTLSNRADSIATAANLVMGEARERIPVAIISGSSSDGVRTHSARDINRPAEEDLFL